MYVADEKQNEIRNGEKSPWIYLCKEFLFKNSEFRISKKILAIFSTFTVLRMNS